MNIKNLKNQIMNILNLKEEEIYYIIDDRKYHKNDVKFYKEDDSSMIAIYNYRKDTLEIIR